MDLTVIVVSYNTRELTLEALRTTFEETNGLTFEVILVDNCSKDGSAEAVRESFPQVRLIEPGKNLGFGKANNLAAEEANGEFLLLLNPDTEVRDGAIQKLWEFAKRKDDARILGGRTIFADGSENPTSCWNRSTLQSTVYACLGLSSLFRYNRLFNPETLGVLEKERYVDIVTGCFLMIRKADWEKLGGFDLTFFMYGEDADLCLRAKQNGWRCAVTPDATIVHYAGASETVRTDKTVRVLSARVGLIQRHWSPWSRRLGVRLVVTRTWFRATTWRLLSWVGVKRAREGAATWGEVFRRRQEWKHGPVQPS